MNKKGILSQTLSKNYSVFHIKNYFKIIITICQIAKKKVIKIRMILQILSLKLDKLINLFIIVLIKLIIKC
jgi:hypothetical protein